MFGERLRELKMMLGTLMRTTSFSQSRTHTFRGQETASLVQERRRLCLELPAAIASILVDDRLCESM